MSSWHDLQVSEPTYLEASAEASTCEVIVVDEVVDEAFALAAVGRMVWLAWAKTKCKENRRKPEHRNTRAVLKAAGIGIRTPLLITGA